ncbi:MAG: GYD domain-containing protein [Planctomycetota bacterium]
MASFLMLGRYSSGALKSISAERTKKVRELVKKSGGEIREIYILLGGYDVAILADFPGTEEAMQASIALAKFTDISFTTHGAVSADKFDKLVG